LSGGQKVDRLIVDKRVTWGECNYFDNARTSLRNASWEWGRKVPLAVVPCMYGAKKTTGKKKSKIKIKLKFKKEEKEKKK
jgi:hypothetical protein